MKRELFDSIAVLPFESGSVIDRSGYKSAILSVSLAAGEQTSVKVEHSDEADGTFTEVPDERLFVNQPKDKDTGEAVIVNKAPVEAVANLDIDLIGCKNFVKITVTGGTAGAIALGDVADAPVGRGPIVYAEELTEAQEALAASVDTVITSALGTSPTGCTVAYDANAQSVSVTLTDSAANVSGTGLINTLTSLVEAGNTVTLNGTTVASVDDVKATDFYTSIAALTAGADPVTATVTVTDSNGVSVDYTITVSYPA